MVRYIVENDENTVFESGSSAYLLLVVNGRGSQSFPLRGTIHLGRDKNNGVVIADKKVSRHHATLTPIEDTYILADQGSANGTYLNGVLISQPTRLKHQDKISIGDTIFLFLTSLQDVELSEEATPPLSSVSVENIPMQLLPQDQLFSIPSLNSMLVWALVGCMGLAIIALLLAIAVLFGLIIGRGQVITGLALFLLLTGF